VIGVLAGLVIAPITRAFDPIAIKGVPAPTEKRGTT
jgi:hypothetical protein